MSSHQEQIVATYKSGYGSMPPEQQKDWYGSIIQSYDQVRPKYPTQLIKRVVTLAQLPNQARILEIGCGPGTATVEFAKLGFKITALEPNIAAFELAKQNCANHPNIIFQNTTFEEFALDPNSFDAIIAATSFHWVNPATAYIKTFEALKDQGSLILLWNMVPQCSFEIYQVLEAVYQDQKLDISRYEDQQMQLNTLQNFEQSIRDSGLFKNIQSGFITCELSYSPKEYLDLLSTLSPYIALESQQRNRLFDLLGQALGTSDPLKLSYISSFNLAQK